MLKRSDGRVLEESFLTECEYFDCIESRIKQGGEVGGSSGIPHSSNSLCSLNRDCNTSSGSSLESSGRSVDTVVYRNSSSEFVGDSNRVSIVENILSSSGLVGPWDQEQLFSPRKYSSVSPIGCEMPFEDKAENSRGKEKVGAIGSERKRSNSGFGLGSVETRELEGNMDVIQEMNEEIGGSEEIHITENVNEESAREVDEDDTRENRRQETLLGLDAIKLLVRELNKSNSEREEKSNISMYREGMEIETYLNMFEATLLDAGVGVSQWKGVLRKKLPPKVLAEVQDLYECRGVTYKEVKCRLLQRVGTPVLLAGNKIFNEWIAQNKGKLNREGVRKLAALVDRIFSECRGMEEMKTVMLSHMVRITFNPDQQHVFETLNIKNRGDLYGAVDHVVAIWQSKENKFSSSDSGSVQSNSGRSGSVSGNGSGHYNNGSGRFSTRSTCYLCGKVGHVAKFCRSRWSNGSGQTEREVTCYSCGNKGHIAVDCKSKPTHTEGSHGNGYHSNPRQPVRNTSYNSRSTTPSGSTVSSGQNQGSSTNSTRPKPKGEKNVPVNVIQSLADSPNTIDICINGKPSKMVIDSGAGLSVVHKNYVTPEQMTGDVVNIYGFSGDYHQWPTAIVKFTAHNISFTRVVACVELERFTKCGLLAYNLLDEDESVMVKKLLLAQNLFPNGEEQQGVESQGNSVSSIRTSEPQSMSQEGEEPKRDEYKPQALPQEGEGLDMQSNEAAKKGTAERHGESSRQSLAPITQETLSVNVLTRNQSNQLHEEEEAVNRQQEIDGGVASGRNLGPQKEVINSSPELDSLQGDNTRGSEDEDFGRDLAEEDAGEGEVCLVRRAEELPLDAADDGRRCLVEMGLPVIKSSAGVEDLKRETAEDPTLNSVRHLADRKMSGYAWKDGLIISTIVDKNDFPLHRLVLPTSKRGSVLRLAHYHGHAAYKRMRSLIRKRFVWPGVTRDILNYVSRCEVCARKGKNGPRKIPMVERPVLREPFEAVGVDIVGPMPRTKRGHKYMLTYICLATKWPEAVPLKSITARSVAQGLVEIFSRTGIPMSMLTDQGSQFLSKVTKELCGMLGVEQLNTTPYHPECNGSVERMHSTLCAMLAKNNKESEWDDALPLALFAIRSLANRDTGFSPYKLIFGHSMRTPLDVLYNDWVEDGGKYQKLDEWVESLRDRIEGIRDEANTIEDKEKVYRKKSYDKGKVARVLEPGQLVLCRIPGMAGKLQDSWEGPWKVIEKLGPANYRLVDVHNNRKNRVCHINTCKVFNESEYNVCTLTIVNKEGDLVDKPAILSDERCTEVNRDELDTLFVEYADVFSDTPGKCTLGKVTIKLMEGVEPTNVSPYKVPLRLKDAVAQELDNLEEKGIIRRSNSIYNSPVVPIVKDNGQIRICVDYRDLNKKTWQIQHKIPEFNELLDEVGRCKCISKLDLCKGFFQIELDEDSKKLTSFSTSHGKYEFQRLPMGLKNSPAVFQGLMEDVLRPFKDFCNVYVDDLLVYSKDPREHVSHLRSVLQALREAGLTASPSKCQLGRKYLLYLGHRLGEGKIAVPQNRVDAIRDFPKPKTRKQMRRFLGTIGFYRKFVPSFAQYSAELTPSTSVRAPKQVTWTPEMEWAYNNLKCELCKSVVLFVPSVNDEFQIVVDSSSRAVGAVLNVLRDGEWLPVSFFSKQLSMQEKNYSATELELLGVVKSIKHWNYYLYNSSFSVVSDHKALCSIMSSQRLNRRLRGFVLFLQDYSFDIEYRPGKEIPHVDGLSRMHDEEDADEEEQNEEESLNLMGLKEDEKETITERKKCIQSEEKKKRVNCGRVPGISGLPASADP